MIKYKSLISGYINRYSRKVFDNPMEILYFVLRKNLSQVKASMSSKSRSHLSKFHVLLERKLINENNVYKKIYINILTGLANSNLIKNNLINLKTVLIK